MGELEAVGDVGDRRGCWRARSSRTPASRRRRPHRTKRTCLNCGAPLVGDYCHACGQHGHVHRTLGAFWPRPAPRRAPFRRQDLAHLADAGLAAGRADPPLHRRPARPLRLADRAVPVLGVPDVRGGQLDRHARPTSIRTRSRPGWKPTSPSSEAKIAAAGGGAATPGRRSGATPAAIDAQIDEVREGRRS